MCAKKTEDNMVKLIGGELWYCCPFCGQKIHKIEPDANCHGVTTFCKKCKKEVPLEIKADKGDYLWRVSRR